MSSVRFETTIWTVIKQAKQKDPEALKKFIDKYRTPVINFIESKGYSFHDAEDLAQNIFLKIFQDDLLGKADKSKGRFRSLLLAVVKNEIKQDLQKRSRQKRGSGRPVLSLEEKREKGFIEDLIVPEEKDEEFDRLWVQNLVKVALEKLKEECLSKATPYFELLKMHVIDELSHDQIAERSGKTNKNVRDLLHIARQKLKRYIIEEIALYASSDQEFKDEVGYLSRLLR